MIEQVPARVPTLRRRRRSLLALLPAALLSACAGPAPAPELPPIVFVHGNGDSAALWQAQVWRFESNGWPRGRLVAVNMPYPLARSDDTQPQEGRSSAAEQARYLAGEVDRVLKATGAKQVVLYGNSRGGNAIRSCIEGGCAGKVSHAILGGTPNHGIWSNPGFQPNSELNGAGPVLKGLNAPKGPSGDEVTPGLAWMTLRSDNNDKYAQPEGVWIGAKGTPTGVTAEGPALKGATNVVLPGRDHRELAYHADAFAEAYRFITGRDAARTEAVAEVRVVLDGLVTGEAAAGPTNLPLPGARVAVYAVDAATGQRRGAALVDKTVGADGHWGPITTDPNTPLEFELRAAGFAVTHIYRSPFPRSSALVHLRPETFANADKDAVAVVTFVRPRAYFGLPRDAILLDGQPAPGIPPGVAGVATSKLKLKDSGRSVVGEFRSGIVNERVAGIAWPAAQGDEQHLTVLELTN